MQEAIKVINELKEKRLIKDYAIGGGMAGNPMNKSKEMKILINGNKTITRRELFESKEKFHRQQARLPFEEKIRMVYNLQKIAGAIKPARTKLQE